MGFVTSQVVDAPLDEVFAWHQRPGAVHRLTPPWQPVRVRSEAESLRDGRAVLSVPPGLRWVAQHRADGYQERRRFTDELTSFPLRTLTRWRHVHEFDAAGPESTRVTDRVDTLVPDALLRPMFAYRHRQLAADLAVHAAHRETRESGAEPMTVAVSGSSGLVGSALTAFLSTGGHHVVRLVRRPARAGDERHWRPHDPDGDLLVGVDAVVHLAGEPIAGRFTDRHRRALRDSRIGPTRRLAELAASTDGVRCLVTASAVGYYGPDRGSEVLTEDSPRGDGFLADLVDEWERASTPARDAGVRVVNVRTGIVQSPAGGVLRLLYPVFFAGLGGRIGDGRQWMSWIGIDDLLDVYLRAVLDERLTGPVNAVAPAPVTNDEYTRVLGRVLRRPTLLTVPSAAPRAVLGTQAAEEFAQASQRVEPYRLAGLGHRFRSPDLDGTLRHLLGRLP
ncbi:hypothetical protein CLV30_102412 [Haloactinopolyspora alba]|uniref:TIGR01777 family protein n=1 Tax=Haloactinopolyspora alba TaxID=648780 RepID=A0A2P8EC29_9ACTN|nr:TIGR01777 family oxidoreductase [Haloactinopolyspora alba]PSL07023.1 hypothetical protein CLV30_102412 [Haloactinopolyspora alba]